MMWLASQLRAKPSLISELVKRASQVGLGHSPNRAKPSSARPALELTIILIPKR